MWTHNIQNKFISGGQLRVTTQFVSDSGEPSYAVDFSPSSLNDLKLQIQRELNRLATQDALIPTIGSGAIDLTVTSTPPTTLQTDAQQFSQDWMRWQQVEKAIANQILTGTEPQVTAFLTRVKNEFQQVITDAEAAGQTVGQAWITALNLL